MLAAGMGPRYQGVAGGRRCKQRSVRNENYVSPSINSDSKISSCVRLLPGFRQTRPSPFPHTLNWLLPYLGSGRIGHIPILLRLLRLLLMSPVLGPQCRFSFHPVLFPVPPLQSLVFCRHSPVTLLLLKPLVLSPLISLSFLSLYCSQYR